MARWRGAITLGVVSFVAVVGITASGGLAANRDGATTLEGVPGPARVTYGKNVGYRSTFDNISPSGTFTHTTFVMEAPIADGVEATFAGASCGNQTTTTNAAGRKQYSCDFGQLRPDDPALLVTIAWRAPDLLVGHPSCTTAAPCTMSAHVRWLVKERISDQPDTNDTFSAGPVVTTLLGQPDLAEAGAFQLAGSTTSPSACQSTTSPSLETNQSLGTGNKLSTRLCVPPFGAGAALGLASKIDENPAIETGLLTEVSTVCVADLGSACGTDDPFLFIGAKLISVFRVPASALPKGANLTTWFHQPDGAAGALTSYPMASSCTSSPECATITYSSKTKIWTIVTQTTSNGRYGGG